jgi:predicted GIY-YIG superfamily endonuclease
MDGTEYGPRIAEIGNWSGMAIYATRATIQRILTRHELENPGVYCLKSSPSNDIYNERIYVGEAENLKTRIKQHLADPKKEFTEVIAFMSKDELLTKSHIKYLESRIVEEAHESKSAEIENGNKPKLPTLHEADIDDMEYFLDQIKLILPVMGFSFLVSTIIKEETTCRLPIFSTVLNYKILSLFKASWPKWSVAERRPRSFAFLFLYITGLKPPKAS